MKTLYLICTFLIIGCVNPNPTIKSDGKYGREYETLTIDSCEYIRSSVYMGDVLTHKGNCKNVIHQHK
jgi:hypothetical protein